MSSDSRLPPIFRKGFLQSPDGDPIKKSALDDIVPIEHIINWYKARLNKNGIENRVLILKAETASGKSTAVPPYIFDKLIPKNLPGAPGIICTQPRVLTAIENVREMLLWYPFLRSGDTVGWSTGYNKLKARNYALLSATVDTLAAQLKVMTDDEVCNRYRFILIDETHERNLATDMTICMLKNFLLRNGNKPECPFVTLMSATFEPQIFLNYFGVELDTNFIWVKGQSYVIKERWDWNQERTVSDFARAAADVVKIICTQDNLVIAQDRGVISNKVVEYPDEYSKCDILIFMPGTQEINDTMTWLRKVNEWLYENKYPVFSALKLDSNEIAENSLDYRRAIQIPINDYQIKVSGNTVKPFRKVILATTVAETGLTLSDLKYVIDAGFSREVEYYPTLGVSGLITKPAQKPRIQQRRGRAGRKAYGEFYPLYPKYIWEKLPIATNAAILIEDVGKILIDIIVEQLKAKYLSGDLDPSFEVADINMLENPTNDAINAAMEKLYAIGFISPYAPKFEMTDGNIVIDITSGAMPSPPVKEKPRMGITRMGLLARSFGTLSPENIRMLFASFMWGVSPLDIISIIAYLELGRPPVETAVKKEDGSEPPLVVINWQEVYAKGVPKYMDTPELYYKMRLLISDDFIDGAVLFHAVCMASIDTPDNLGINNLENWCARAKLSFRGIMAFLTKREELIEAALISGVNMLIGNPTLAQAQQSEYIDIIARLKHCIYDGYRSNLLVRDETTYYTTNGTRVKIPALINDQARSKLGIKNTIMPRYVIYRELAMKMNRKTEVYDIHARIISVMDGYVSVDVDFLN